MFKSILFSAALCFLANIVSSQHIQFDWQSCIKGGKYNTERSVLCKADSGYFVAAMQDKGSHVDIVLLKTSLTGDSLWRKYYGGSDGDWPCGIFPTMDSNYYIVGTTLSNDGDITYNPYPGFANIWVVKIDSSGNKLWDKVYGGSNSDEANNAIVTHDGGLAILGSTYSYNGDITNFYGARDVWVLKLDQNGNKQWDFTVGTPGFDYSYDITQVKDSGFIISGGFKEGSQGNIQCYNSDSNYLDGFIYRLDRDGAPVDKKCYPGKYHENVQQVIELPDGYLISAITSSPDVSPDYIGFHIGYTHTGYPTDDIWLQKTDFNWNIEWQRCYGGSDWDHIYRIFPCSNGDYMMFGTTNSHEGDVSDLHGYVPGYTAEDDIWMVRLNANGDILWQRCIGTYGAQRIQKNSILKLGEADYVIACTIEGGGFDDILCTYEYTGVTRYFTWLFQITDTAASVGKTEQLPRIKIKLYPNPATDYIALEIPPEFDMKQTIAEIINASGITLKKLNVSEKQQVFDVTGYRSGIYLLRISDAKNVSTARFIVE